MTRKKVLFVTYGGGHVSMVVPVAQALLAQELADVQVLALTTAAAVTRSAGLDTLRFKDFVQPSDEQALRWGENLMKGLERNGLVEPEETRAYLGLSFADLVEAHGLQAAERMYADVGRYCFLPVRTLERILRSVAPDLVVITNSPRAEQAAGLAARNLGIPALCINSMFAIDEIAWIGQPGFCDLVCVLNDAVRQTLIAAGRAPEEVVVTGNPSFDPLLDPRVREQGLSLRRQLAPEAHKVVLWASQPEPVAHPTAPGLIGDPQLPGRILGRLMEWVGSSGEHHLLVRPHPNETLAAVTHPQATLVAGPAWPIEALLHACDVLVTMTSTVAVQANVAGCPVLQVRGSIFDHSMPLARMGMARECHPDRLSDVLHDMLNQARHHGLRPEVGERGQATARVTQVVANLLRTLALPVPHEA